MGNLFLRILIRSFYYLLIGRQIGLFLSFAIKLTTSSTNSLPLNSLLILLKFSCKFLDENISLNLQTIGATDSRDYGNFNSPKHGSNYADVKLPAYFVNHLTINFDLIPDYDVFFKITNLTNEDYHTALHYSQPGRGFSLGLKKSFD